VSKRVKAKQQNSKNCIVCGLVNPFSLKASFYELENDELVSIFTPSEVHQGYPGRLHGGLTTAILDETIGRAINAKSGGMIWGVTVEFTSKFRKPVPLNEELRVVGRITEENSRFFEGTGEIILPNGEVAAEGRGRYLKQSIERIAGSDVDKLQWQVVPHAHDPEEIEV
jgi:acyl-coenzyme A thioesterase PaaI-like protein